MTQQAMHPEEDADEWLSVLLQGKAELIACCPLMAMFKASLLSAWWWPLQSAISKLLLSVCFFMTW
jgi:hypothetical protein